MNKISQYIFTFLLLSPIFCLSQDKTDEWRYNGPRIGIDLSRFLLPALQKGDRHGWEIQGDIPYKGNYFPTLELGMQWFDDREAGFHYMNNGAYGRLGVDINIEKFQSLQDYDIVFVGVRYGYARFNEQVNNINYTNYWGTINTSFPKKSISAHWAELVFGMKGEIFSNVFLGWSLRIKFPFYQTYDPNIIPYIIPGIGKTTGEVPADFSFTLSYRIPMFKTKTLPKPLKIGGAKHPNANPEEGQQYPGQGGQQYPGQGGQMPQGQGNIRY